MKLKIIKQTGKERKLTVEEEENCEVFEQLRCWALVSEGTKTVVQVTEKNKEVFATITHNKFTQLEVKTLLHRDTIEVVLHQESEVFVNGNWEYVAFNEAIGVLWT